MARWFAFILLLSVAQPLAAQTTNDFFNGDVLQEIRIDVNPKDWKRLKDNFLENTYYPADMHWVFNGKFVEAPQVAIRSRGTGSRSGVKPGLLVDFDRYNSRRRFLGLKSVVLRNNVQDATMLHERVSFAFMRRLGIPAPRAVHARLLVNGEYMGLYTIVENIDDAYLADRFKDGDARLFEYDYGRFDPPYFFGYKGDATAQYSPTPFKPATHASDPQADRIAEMVRTINQATNAQFDSAVGAYLDWDAFIAELSAEAYLAEADGIVGDFGLNNFFLYRQSATNRYQLVPWDKSQTFDSVARPLWNNIFSNVLTNRAFLAAGGVPRLRDAFTKALIAAAASAGGSGGWLEQEIVKEYNQIRDAARLDTQKFCDFNRIGALLPCTNDNFEAGITDMILFARTRNDRLVYSIP